MSDSTNTGQKSYDVIIVGVGPAGLTASIYASRYKLSNLIIGKLVGGELSLAHKVENYPGFESISGIDLSAKWKEQAEKLGANILLKEVGKIQKLDDGSFLVQVSENEQYRARTVIVATGSERRRLNIPGETEYTGKGVSYCTTCDAPFFKDKTVALIGGSDSAVSGAVHTAEYAKKVYIIYRKDVLRAEPIWLAEWKQILGQKRGEAIFNTNITEILGDSMKVTGVKLDKPYQGKDTLTLDGVFIEIGGVPGTALVQPLGIELDETGHVKVNVQMETNVIGLFCAGDMVDKSIVMKQAITAMAQGAKAAGSAYKYIKNQAAPQIRGI
ncbi:NAD(P)/FAD-dependent oxidoreductase [Patescibacteria group bacterium]